MRHLVTRNYHFSLEEPTMTTTQKPDFASLTIAALLAIYNDLAKELREMHGKACEDRKAFRDKPTAIAACERRWLEIHQAQRADNEGEKTVTDETISDEAAAPAEAPKAKRAKKVATEKKAKAPKAAKAAKSAKASPKKPASEAKGQRGRAPLYPDNAKIKVLTKENLGRDGTTSQETFKLLKASKTFGDFRAAGGNLKYAYWFQNRGHVSIGA
ncbi:MAG TPA: hypothetical protein VMS08_03625 [Candidatus Saccharimonadia bacterium]|nr:hypothetical protein [Candidatus Saccharimonadia bacterium]